MARRPGRLIGCPRSPIRCAELMVWNGRRWWGLVCRRGVAAAEGSPAGTVDSVGGVEGPRLLSDCAACSVRWSVLRGSGPTPRGVGVASSVLVVGCHALASCACLCASVCRAASRRARGNERTPDAVSRCRHHRLLRQVDGVSGSVVLDHRRVIHRDVGRLLVEIVDRVPPFAHGLGHEPVRVARLRSTDCRRMRSAPSASGWRTSLTPRRSTANVEFVSPSLTGGQLLFRRLLFAGLEYGALILGTKPLLQSRCSFATARRRLRRRSTR